MRYKFELLDSDNNSTEISEPIGWDVSAIKVKRDKKYHGIFYEYTNDLEFIGNGYLLLRTLFETYGILSDISLKISVQCATDLDFEEVFTGKGNFSNFSIKEGNFCSCTLNFEEQNESLTLFNNMDKKFDLFDGTDINEMTLHSKGINLTGVFTESELTSPQIPLFGTVASPFNVCNQLPMIVASNDIASDNDNGVFDAFNTNAIVDTVLTDIFPQLQKTLVAPYTGIYNFKGNLAGSLRLDSPFNYSLSIAAVYYVINDTNPPVKILEIGKDSGTITGNNVFDFDEDFDFDITLNVGDVVKVYQNTYLNFFNAINSEFYIYLNLSNVDFVITTLSITDSSTARTVLIHEAFDKATEKLFGVNKFKSDLFGRKDIGYLQNGCGSFTSLTNGLSVRKFEEKPFFTSFKSLFDAVQPVFNLGIGFEDGKVVVEPIEYFYNRNEVVIQFNTIRTRVIEMQQDYIFNTIRIGYSKDGTEEGTDKANTLDGFATIREFNTPITQVKNEYLAVSSGIADHYAIEFTRRQQYKTTSTNDWKFDNDIFIIATKRTVDEDGYPTELNLAEKNENFLEVNNILSPETSYNLRLSPVRNLLLHNKQFSGAYCKVVGSKATFSSATKNYLMTSKLNSLCSNNYEKKLLAENQDLVFDDENNTVNKPLFEPYTVTFDAPLSWTNYKTIKTATNAEIKVNSINDTIIQGFILNLEYNPQKGLASIQLLKSFVDSDECNMDYVESDYVECDYVE
jgi:hypothetical protein